MTNRHLWWQTGVIYQIYPRSFADTTGNGVGDLKGIIQKLDYLSDTLGVDAIWLSPFYPSPMADFGYDVADYTDVDPLFGDLEDFDRLVSIAHKRGIKIIIDLVPNHSSDQHAWFQESRASRESPKRDWYIWGDPKPDGSPPNNWLSVFGGPAWEWEKDSGQYYLHSFLKEQPDLNWRNPTVREAMLDVVRFWLERGVDGFRVDVAHYIMKDPEMRDNPVNPEAAKSIHRPLGEYDSQFHLYDKGHPDVHEAYRQFRQVLDEYSHDSPRMAVGEIHIFNWEEWASYYGKNLDELHMPYNFSLLGVPWKAEEIRKTIDELEAALPPGAWPNYVLGNHDEDRLASRIGIDQVRIAAMLLLTLRGTPTIYFGEEIGMTSVEIPRERQKDPAGLRQAGQGRDLCRTPMQWSAEPNAGFSSPATKELWLPIGENYQEVNVLRQIDDEKSILTLYRRLLALRAQTPALQWGDYQPIDGTPRDCFVYLRTTPDEKYLMALNFSSEALYIDLPHLGKGIITLSTYLDREGSVDLMRLELRSNEGLVIQLNL
jgi:alpha-glucosidase